MPTQVSKGSVVGLAYAQIWRTGTDGLAYGTVGEGAAAGTTMHAHLLQFMKTANLPNPARVVTQLTGGNRWLGQVMFGPSNFGNFQMTSADLDTVALALTGGSLVDITTNSRWRRAANNINNIVLPQMGLMLTTIFQSREDDSDGAELYVNYIIPRCQIDIALPQLNYQGEGVATWTVSPLLATKEPHGLPFSAGAMGLKGNKALAYAIVSPKPLGLTTHVALDNAETTFTLGYKPSSNIVTLNAAANEHVKNGALVALSSVSTSTAVATKATGAASDKHGVLYETEFEAVA